MPETIKCAVLTRCRQSPYKSLRGLSDAMGMDYHQVWQRLDRETITVKQFGAIATALGMTDREVSKLIRSVR